MFDPHQRSTGTGYTRTVALLAGAFVFIPVALMMSRPVGYATVFVAAACSVLCVWLAWANWKKSSELTIPSILTQRERAK
jgi:hypothetical protein